MNAWAASNTRSRTASCTTRRNCWPTWRRWSINRNSRAKELDDFPKNRFAHPGLEEVADVAAWMAPGLFGGHDTRACEAAGESLDGPVRHESIQGGSDA